jgi:Ca2+-binding RTX toxin-like protein
MGRDGNDMLWAAAAPTILHGGKGNDTLNGGAGKDYMYDDAGTTRSSTTTSTGSQDEEEVTRQESSEQAVSPHEAMASRTTGSLLSRHRLIRVRMSADRTRRESARVFHICRR